MFFLCFFYTLQQKVMHYSKCITFETCYSQHCLGLWPEKLTDHQRDAVCRRCRCCSARRKGAEKPDITKMAPRDMEGKPFPNYLQYVKSANGREKIRIDYFKDVWDTRIKRAGGPTVTQTSVLHPRRRLVDTNILRFIFRMTERAKTF